MKRRDFLQVGVGAAFVPLGIFVPKKKRVVVECKYHDYSLEEGVRCWELTNSLPGSIAFVFERMEEFFPLREVDEFRFQTWRWNYSVMVYYVKTPGMRLPMKNIHTSPDWERKCKKCGMTRREESLADWKKEQKRPGFGTVVEYPTKFNGTPMIYPDLSSLLM